MRQVPAYFLMFLCLFVFCSCLPMEPEQKRGLVPVPEKRAKKLAQEINPVTQGMSSFRELHLPLQRSTDYLSNMGSRRIHNASGRIITRGRLLASIAALESLLSSLDYSPELLADYFDWYELQPGPFYTGYFEPQLQASLEKRPGYPYPLYGVPPDLKKADLGQFHPRWEGQRLIYRIEEGRIKPYFERSEITGQKALQGKAPVVAWARDLMDVFFLEIQGSGRLLLPDGSSRHIGYAGKNGRQYVSLGRVMIEKGYLEKGNASMQSIRSFIQQHPELLPEILYHNPSYVFFTLQDEGPKGAIGRKIEPMISLAVDPSVLPLGSLLFYALDLPARDKEDKSFRLKGLGLAQDTGGAIKGHHLDLFCGSGELAKFRAGNLSTRGKVYLLLLKEELMAGYGFCKDD